MNTKLTFTKEDKQILKLAYDFAKARKAKLYLVGGAIRDLFLNRKKDNPDFDFCISRGAITFGRALAKKLRAGFVVLDKEHGACRVVLKARPLIYTLDFTDFRGKNLEEDLLHRDLSINSLALELDKVFTEHNLADFIIDPAAGRQDLAKGIIRVSGKDSFKEDPLRVLRAFSYAAIFGFQIENKTLALAKKFKQKISTVSPERIRDELFKIFHTPFTHKSLVMLDNLKMIKILFPETVKMRNIGQGPYHHLDVWQHTLETVRQFELLLDKVSKDTSIKQYLDEATPAERKRVALVKFAAFLHDVGKPGTMRRKKNKITFHGHERLGSEMAEDIAKRLKLSNWEVGALCRMIQGHLRPGFLADNEVITARAKFRFFRDTQREAVAVLLLSLADQRATKGPLTTKTSRSRHEKACFSLIKEYFKKDKEKQPQRLINGDDLLSKFKLEPSPLIGKILAEIEELQAIGKVKTKQDALAASARIIARHPALS